MFDCINRQKLLPTEDYSPGSLLPPHLSPFVKEEEGDYVPPERQRELNEDRGEGEEMEMGEVELEQKAHTLPPLHGTYKIYSTAFNVHIL